MNVLAVYYLVSDFSLNWIEYIESKCSECCHRSSDNAVERNRFSSEWMNFHFRNYVCLLINALNVCDLLSTFWWLRIMVSSNSELILSNELWTAGFLLEWMPLELIEMLVILLLMNVMDAFCQFCSVYLILCFVEFLR